jgi:SAM-dependent methyltransferase
MIDSELSARLDVTWGDPGSWVANGLQWTHLEEISALVNRRITGDSALSPLGWFGRRLASQGALPLRRALVLGCGSGWVERQLHDQGWASEIVAFDLSSKVMEVARTANADVPSIHYVQADMNQLPVGQPPFEPGSYDAVLGLDSVHHCAEMERLYADVGRLLVPGGWFFLNEYVGPDRFQYSAAHIEQLSALAARMPEHMMTTHSGEVRRGFRAPTIDEVVAVDPSEAVCSSRILPLLDGRFDIVARRSYAGGVLQLLLSDVAQNFQPPQAKPWLQALIDAEEDLDRLGLAERHFACVIARRPGASAPVDRAPRGGSA